MASIAAALAAFTLSVWGLSVVLMSTSYQTTAVVLAALGFATGSGHAVMRLCESRTSPPEYPVIETSFPKGETQGGLVMHSETPSQRFFGVTSMVIALSIALGVVAYFVQVFWRNQTPDLGLTVGETPIPAETYPIILLSLWTLSQRAMSTWRPHVGTLGAVAWWIDLVSSGGVFAFLAYTFFSSIMGGTSHVSFLIILFAFNVQGFGDLFLNGRHYYGNAGGPAHELLGGILTGNAAVGPYSVTPEVIIEPVYKVRQPDGSLRDLPAPARIGGPAGT